jgi:hypothetical protein
MEWLPLAVTLTLLAAPPPAETVAPLCTPQAQIAQMEPCPALGPGLYAAQYAEARLPDALPELITERLPMPAKVIDFVYARVTTPEAPLFATPEEAAAGSPAKTIGRGFVFVNLVNQTQHGDQVLYQIRGGEYIRAGDVTVVEPTRFQGLKLTERPAYPFGWVVANVRPSPAPGAAAPRETRSLRRGLVVQIFGEVQVGRWKWYLLGPGQWVEQRALSVITFNPPPEGVTGKWAQVDLYEQTLVAYEGATPVYATLVSSGLDKWATQPGLFQIYARLLTDRMSGAYAPDKSDYYYLEAVPWVMYFDGDRALHGEYWHDRLGFKRSHGCVNLSPLDSKWLYNWSERGTYVWVYDPSGQTKADGVAEGP